MSGWQRESIQAKLLGGTILLHLHGISETPGLMCVLSNQTVNIAISGKAAYLEIDLCLCISGGQGH